MCSLVFPEDVVQLSQQLYWYVAELETLVVKERKRHSIPAAAQEVANPLFTQDDLRHEKQVLSVNRAGMFSSLESTRHLSHFPTFTGFKG